MERVPGLDPSLRILSFNRLGSKVPRCPRGQTIGTAWQSMRKAS